ncbi:MAG: hypothetical protein L0241_32185, partial [Planctomycetia bacterium]|nr:hypothetical protein [Planctomycetia bacterium]
APEIIEVQPRGPKPDPNRPLIPSREEIEKLPRWAKVAFAARCAHRVLPLVRLFWPEAPAEDVRTVASAVEIAERCAAQGSGDGELTKACAAARAVYEKAEDVDAAYAAADAAVAAEFAGTGNTSDLLDATRGSAACAFSLLTRVATLGTARIVMAPARDLDRLTRLAKEQNWTDDTPVPQEVFGPMWDRDPPPWWREDVLEGLSPEIA